MASENEMHARKIDLASGSKQSFINFYNTIQKESKGHLKEVYAKVDQNIKKRQQHKKWEELMFSGITVMQDEDEILFQFHSLSKKIEMKGRFYLKAVEQNDSFLLLKHWLPPSIEVNNIWPNEKAVNKNELVQIIQRINNEFQSFHSRLEQLRKLEDHTKDMKLKIFYPESRKVVVLTITDEDSNKEVYSLILKYKSSHIFPFDVSIESSDMEKNVEEALLHKASVFKEMVLWKAFRKYTFPSDRSRTSKLNDKKSQGRQDQHSSQIAKSADGIMPGSMPSSSSRP